ncbi:hypothetical protein [Leptolyngbya sp. CCY15150]|uniref:hypothetical protein n=1 Tax=Leptolyngbya sp. CCY15150 TaxID=2767772 RepID=UPI00194EE5D6|nr:hypothetical protein [Leptolyngbya sp. CCY15150]
MDWGHPPSWDEAPSPSIPQVVVLEVKTAGGLDDRLQDERSADRPVQSATESTTLTGRPLLGTCPTSRR